MSRNPTDTVHDEVELDIAACWALRRVYRGMVRQHEPAFFTDGGRAVPDWLVAACSALLDSGHLAPDPARGGFLALTAAGIAALRASGLGTAENSPCPPSSTRLS
jgi:hypothetical protein